MFRKINERIMYTAYKYLYIIRERIKNDNRNPREEANVARRSA